MEKKDEIGEDYALLAGLSGEEDAGERTLGRARRRF